MNTQSKDLRPEDLASPLSADLRAEQVRLYDANVPTAVTGSVLVAVLLVAAQWGTIAGERIVAWLACLALALSLRALPALPVLVRRRESQARKAGARSLLYRRLTIIGLGAAWGLAGVLLFPTADLQHQMLLAFVLAGIVAGSMTLNFFDPVGAVGFAVMALTPVTVRLFTSADRASSVMGAMVLLFVALLALISLHAFRNVKRLQLLSEQLTRKTEALEVTLDSMSQGILSLDAQGRTHFFNRRLVELTDLPESFLATRPLMDDIARYQAEHGHFGKELEFVDATARDHLANWLGGNQQAFPDSYFRRTVSGLVLEVRTRYLGGGGLVRTFSDVTAFFDAQRQLRDSEAQARKLALVAAHTEDAVAILDARRQVEWINEGFTRMTGFRLEEVTGRTLGQILPGPESDPDANARHRERVLSGEDATGELDYHAKDGRAGWLAVEVRAVPDEAGQILQFISIGRDITARKQAEQALRTARDEAERANRAKSDFLSAMSHELRTPMNAILGFGQLLESDPAHPLPERQRAYVHQILRAGGHLLELINDVLDLARVEAGKQPVSIEPVEVRHLVDDCLRLMQAVAQERGIVLSGIAPDACACFVAADRTRLRQVLLNLLSNAIKYNRAGGSVHVACAADGDGVRIGVTDTGFGLSAEQLGRLFNAFERLGADNGAVQGAGIGLVLSQGLMALMHGSIGVDSVVGQGSTFWVRLPRAQAVPEPEVRADVAAPVAQAVAAVGRTHTVLYIEDNPVNQVLMEAMLGREPGLRLIMAALPEVGLDLARAQRPDLILLDIQLPGIDGYEVLRRLRADPATRATPVIAISANAMRQDIQLGMAAGFDDYLTKPLNLPQLLATLRKTLRA